MADVLFLALVMAFFGLAVLYVRACAALAGPEPLAPGDEPDEVEP